MRTTERPLASWPVTTLRCRLGIFPPGGGSPGSCSGRGARAQAQKARGVAAGDLGEVGSGQAALPQPADRVALADRVVAAEHQALGADAFEQHFQHLRIVYAGVVMEGAQELARVPAADVLHGVGAVQRISVHAAEIVREITAAVRDHYLQLRTPVHHALVDERGEALRLLDRLPRRIPQRVAL